MASAGKLIVSILFLISSTGFASTGCYCAMMQSIETPDSICCGAGDAECEFSLDASNNSSGCCGEGVLFVEQPDFESISVSGAECCIIHSSYTQIDEPAIPESFTILYSDAVQSREIPDRVVIQYIRDTSLFFKEPSFQLNIPLLC